jgi:hypothetical protein
MSVQSHLRHFTQFHDTKSGAHAGLNQFSSSPQGQRSHERRNASQRMCETRMLGLITLMAAVTLVGCTPSQTRSTIPSAGMAPATGNSDACLHPSTPQIQSFIDSEMKQVDAMRTTAATCSPQTPLGQPAQPCAGDACAAFDLNFLRQSAKPDFNLWLANTASAINGGTLPPSPSPQNNFNPPANLNDPATAAQNDLNQIIAACQGNPAPTPGQNPFVPSPTTSPSQCPPKNSDCVLGGAQASSLSSVRALLYQGFQGCSTVVQGQAASYLSSNHNWK